MTTRRDFIKHLLSRAKLQAPDKVSAPNPDVVDVWVERIPLELFPPRLWEEAIDHWADHVTDGLLKPRDLVRSAHTIRDRWESIPEKRDELNRVRAARLKARISAGELPSGVTPLTRPENQPDGKPAGENAPRRWTGTPLQAKLRAKTPPRTANTTAETQQQALDNLDALLATVEAKHQQKDTE